MKNSDVSTLPAQFSVRDISKATERDWSDSTLSTHAGWKLCIQEPWLDSNLSRVVLIKAPFMISFEFKTDDDSSRAEMLTAATEFAEANRLKRMQINAYQYFACPEIFGFAAPLKGAGWIRGKAAQTLYTNLIENDTTSVELILNQLSGYAPTDHTSTVDEIFFRMFEDEHEQPLPMPQEDASHF